MHIQRRSKSRCSAGSPAVLHSRLRPDPPEHDEQNSAFPRASSEPHLFSLANLLGNNEQSRFGIVSNNVVSNRYPTRDS